MPTYDYVCRACEHRFEHFQSMQEAPLRKCPECGKPRLQRLIGAGAGILFKGSGFYETDYKRKSPPSTEGAKPGGTDGGAAKPDGAKSDGAKSDGRKSDGPRSEGGSKPGGTQPDGSKGDGGEGRSSSRKPSKPA